MVAKRVKKMKLKESKTSRKSVKRVAKAKRAPAIKKSKTAKKSKPAKIAKKEIKREPSKREQLKRKNELEAKALEAAVLNALDEVIDPELGVSIVKMGLIKSVKAGGAKGAEGGREVKIRMTLTSPFCPMMNFLTQSVKSKAEKVAGVKKAVVELVLPNVPTMPESGC